MKNAFLYPGQGSQTVGMGRDLAEHYDLARQRYSQAGEILGFDLAAVCFHGPEAELRQTKVTQPALYVHSCILTDLMKDQGVEASIAAGHSVGEFAALYCAGAFSFAEGLRLVKARAEAMQHAGTVNPGTMAAIVGLSDEDVRGVCAEASAEGIVVPANYNSPGQIVISGAVAAVRNAIEMAKARGAKLAKELSVSGAFHSPLMQPAADALAKALAGADLSDPVIPVIANVTAASHDNADGVRRLLAAQLLSPVRWTESLNEMSSQGPARWFEVGSGNVLAGLLKRTVKGATANGIGSVDDLRTLEPSTTAVP